MHTRAITDIRHGLLIWPNGVTRGHGSLSLCTDKLVATYILILKPSVDLFSKVGLIWFISVHHFMFGPSMALDVMIDRTCLYQHQSRPTVSVVQFTTTC